MTSTTNHKIKLLIVEDDPTQVYLISESLDPEKFEISNIPDGYEAYQYLLTCDTSPDLILLDYHLPTMDGLQIMSSLRDEGRLFNIVFLTADYSIETAIKSINAGALEFIPKDGRFVTNIPAIMNKAYDVVCNKLEKDRFEKALRESEERFKRVLEATNEGVFEWNANSGESYVSPANAAMLGYEPHEFPDTHAGWFKLIHPDDISVLNDRFYYHLHNNTNLYEADIRVMCKNGQYKWIQERGIIVDRDKQGKPVRVIGTHADISERKNAESKILETNRRLTTLIGNLSGIVYRCNGANFFAKEFISERVSNITGYTPDFFTDDNTLFFEQIIHASDIEVVKKQIEQAIENKSAYDLYYKVVTSNKSIKWIWDHGKCIVADNGQIIALEGYMADITDKKESDEALRQSEEEKKIILDNSLQSFILLNNSGNIIAHNRTANHRAILMSGKSIKKGGAVLTFTPDNEKEILKQSFEKALKGEPCYWEYLFETHLGPSWFENVMVPVFVSKDEVKFVCYTSSDITERKLTEEKIIYSENLYNTAINSINDPIYVVDKLLKILLANQSLLRFNKRFSYPENIIGKKLTDVYEFISTQNVKQYESVFKNATEIISEESYLIQGRLFINEIKITPVIKNEKVVRAVTSVRDITERKNFEKRIMHTIIETEERERKRFSEDLHDEMGSLLSTIKIYINTLHKEQIEPAKRAEMVSFTNELINQAIQNSKEIANNLSPSIIKRFGLISALQSFCEKIEVSEQLHIHFASNEYAHKLNEDEEISIYRIIIEMINNTIKHAGAKNINISLSSSDKVLEISYSDDGKGFDFEKMITEKRKGLGLQNIITRVKSLNGSYTIVKLHHPGFGINIRLIL